MTYAIAGFFAVIIGMALLSLGVVAGVSLVMLFPKLSMLALIVAVIYLYTLFNN